VEDLDVTGRRLMLRETDVPRMMTRVATTLTRAARSAQGAVGVMHLAAEGDDEVPVGVVRSKADITIEFPSGSARPVVGPAILLAKRVVRRGLRWYLAPIMEEQSRFNHSVLDLLESLRLQQERLRSDLDALRERMDRPTGAPPQ
jgi:hypothetical protein